MPTTNDIILDQEYLDKIAFCRIYANTIYKYLKSKYFKKLSKTLVERCTELDIDSGSELADAMWILKRAAIAQCVR